MHSVDWVVLIVYLSATVFVGIYVGRLVKNSSDMFSAGGQSPWWMSGLSAFMTMFSANTFVVWGGIAYEQGFVAVIINLCYGIAALFSATASIISSQLNVFSGVLTKNIYEPRVQNPSEKQLVRAGRIFTLILGLVIAGIAIATPYMGGAAKLIISVTQLMVTPLLVPTLLALFFRNLGVSAIWATVGLCFPLGLLIKFSSVGEGTIIADSTFTGGILPLIVIGVILLIQRKEAPGWKTIAETEKRADDGSEAEQTSSALPARIVAASLAACSFTFLALIPFNDKNQVMLAIFGIVLAAPSAFLFRSFRTFPSG